MYSTDRPNFCPICIKKGLQSTLRFVPYGVFTFLRCDDPCCPYNREGHRIVTKPNSAAISKTHVLQLGAPMTLLNEKLAKRKHLKMLSWMKKLKTNVYLWMSQEVNNMMNLSMQSPETMYRVSDDVKKIIAMSKTDVQICKHLIPDLQMIVTIIQRGYNKYILGKPDDINLSKTPLQLN